MIAFTRRKRDLRSDNPHACRPEIGVGQCATHHIALEPVDVAFWRKRDKNCRVSLKRARLGGATSAPRIAPASRSCRSAGKRPERCQPRRPWKSLLPPGRKKGRTCSRSGAELAAAPSVAGSSGPRRAARRTRPGYPACLRDSGDPHDHGDRALRACHAC
jgi:hypothetical protein